MGSFTKYNSIDGANAGARMPIKDASGTETEDWLHILGMDSEVFQKGNKKMRRAMMAYLDKHNGATPADEKYVELTIDEQRKLQATLVQSWSFDEPCTPDNVLALFAAAPFVAEQADFFASKRERFVKVLPIPCEPTPSNNLA